MQRTSTPFAGPASCPGRARRRGSIVIWSVLALGMVGLCAAFVVNQAWITAVRSDSQDAVDAAALAAAHAMLSDDLLREAQFPLLAQWRDERCRTAARNVVAEYRRLHTIPDPAQLLIRVDSAADGASGETIPHGVTVAFGTADAPVRLPLAFAGLTGVSSAGVAAIARVEVLNRPAAFRATRQTPVPVLPLVLRDDASVPADESWEWQIEQRHGADRLAWIPERSRPESGADGIPELTVRLGGEGAPLSFLDLQCRFDDQQLYTACVEGLWPAELAELGVPEVTVGGAVRTADDSSADLRRVLTAATGRPRVLCLVTADAASDGPGDASDSRSRRATIVRPVAVRILQVAAEQDGSVRLTVQPCVLVTQTARMEPSAERNPWIYRVRL